MNIPVGGSQWSEEAARLAASAITGEITGASRVVVSKITPSVDNGAVAFKSVVGDPLTIEAQLFADGHDAVAGALRVRHVGGETPAPWTEIPMQHVDGDLFRATILPQQLGQHEYSVAGWIDQFGTWQHDFPRRAGEDAELNLRIGAQLVQGAAERASGPDHIALSAMANALEEGGEGAQSVATSPRLTAMMKRYPDRSAQTVHEPLPLIVNRERARFGSWYEVFPRSLADKPGEHGTLRDVIDDLDRIKDMGFDVVYMPPIHPIGSSFRKGANNAVQALAHEPGVPYAIGSAEGGHTAIHSQLGTVEDFDALVAAAGERDMDIGMDIALQASPDHPWVAEHPSWFKHRPDGTIQYAENPPKKYQDVYPFDFESEDWPELWVGLTDSIMHWADKGVRAFRVDNPHTKPFGFWKYAIETVKAKHPDAIFLSEAFARPNVQDELARVGFDQTYTYFPWKTTPDELRELGHHYGGEGRPDFMIPSHWPTTHDILPENLQGANRDQFALRATLAGTMSPTWGNYGPSYERMENVAREAGSIEYLNSEKYQLVNWVRDGDDLGPVLTQINAARAGNAALQSATPPRFVDSSDPALVAYLRSTPDESKHVLVVGNTDPGSTHRGTLNLPLEDMGIAPDKPYQARDLLDGSVYEWTGPNPVIKLKAWGAKFGPSHVFEISATAPEA